LYIKKSCFYSEFNSVPQVSQLSD